MKYLKAHFRDANHNEDITIINTEEDYKTVPLSFELDGIKFEGSSFDDWELADYSQYEEAVRKFNILKWGGYNSETDHKSRYCYTLQRYSLSVEMPVMVSDKKSSEEITGTIKFAFSLEESHNGCRSYLDEEAVYFDKVNAEEFSLTIKGRKYESGRKTPCFESALDNISDKIKDDYYLKSCLTCQYSEYSPYGNDDYGCMLCYKGNKELCLKVNSKDDFFEYLFDKNFEMRQETYLCSEYSLRNICGGYRGFIKGIEKISE